MVERWSQWVERAVEVARSAPSSHNCQPWGIAIPDRHVSQGELRASAGAAADKAAADTAAADTAAADTAAADTAAADTAAADTAAEQQPFQLIVALDTARQLTALPAHQLEMYLSCGMYLGLLATSLELLGFDSRLSAIEMGSAGSARLPAQWQALALLDAKHVREPDFEAFEAFRELATRRHTNRGAYRRDEALCALQPAEVDGLAWAGLEHPALRLQLQASASGEVPRVLGQLVARRASVDFDDKNAWLETYRYIHLDERADDGFSVAQLFGRMSPTRAVLQRYLLSPAVIQKLGPLGFTAYLARQLGKLVTESPAVLQVFGSEKPTAAELLDAGARIVRFWLQLTRAGLSMHPISVMLQHDHIRAEVQGEMGCEARLLFLARVGRPLQQFPRSARRTLSSQLRSLVSPDSVG